MSDLTREELEEACRELWREIAKEMPEGVGFAFIMFDFGEGGNLVYLSNAERGDMRRALEEFLQKTAVDGTSPEPS